MSALDEILDVKTDSYSIDYIIQKTHNVVTWHEAKQDLAALRSRIAELEALTAWQPIETAPERVDILILVQTRVGVQVEQVEMVDGHYFRLYGVSAEYHNPTHWMPLPKPPEEK